MPATTAVTATLYATSAAASLSIASLSTASPTRSGTPIRLNVAAAETGSVGARIAPSTNAAGQLRSPMAACATTATAAIVTSTRANVSDTSWAVAARSSCGDALKPDECSSGGRKTRKITSGASSIAGRPGTKPIATPPTTSTIGYGIEMRSASRTSTAAAKRTAMRYSMSPTSPEVYVARGRSPRRGAANRARRAAGPRRAEPVRYRRAA